MDTNEIMENEEVVETVQTSAEEIAKVDTGKSYKTVAGVVIGVLGSMVIYKYVIKPLVAKRKAKRSAENLYAEAHGSSDNDVVEVESCEEDTDSEEN